MTFTKEYQEANFEEAMIEHPLDLKELKGLSIDDPRLTVFLERFPKRYSKVDDFPHNPVKTFQDE